MSGPAPLSPDDAASLFRSGSTLCFTATPDEQFVCGQWMGQLCICTPIPFADAAAYFATHPVALYDPAYQEPGSLSRRRLAPAARTHL